MPQFILRILLLIAMFSTLVYTGEPVRLSSPDGDNKVIVELKEKLEPYPSGTRLYYSVRVDGKPLLLDSPFGLEFQDMPPLASHLNIVDTKTRSIDRTWTRVWGKRKVVRDHCNELTLMLQETQPPKRKIHLLFRAYNDGVAMRYYIPEQQAIQSFHISSERTHFCFAGNYLAWATTWRHFITSQEEEFDQTRLSDISFAEITGTPLLVRAGRRTWAAVMEANLIDWAGMTLAASPVIPNAMVTKLSPHVDNPAVAVTSQAPRFSPWRVVMIGQRPGDLIESDLLHNLSDPCALKDVSWIQPGKCAWDRWWAGSYGPDADFELGVNTETMKYYMDIADELNWAYQLIDWHWYGSPFVTTEESSWGPNPDADITTPRDEINMKEILDYGREIGVRNFLWLHWQHTKNQYKQAFPLYEDWGIAGVKIDLWNRNDQEAVNLYHAFIKKAADHKLLVNIHGMYMPTGFSRTYPNFITREGVLGNEYSQWSDRITPEHCLTLPFTRMLGGHMDFTPGGFHHATVDSFRFYGQDHPNPMVMGTRCFQLAMLVVYESALQVLCDSPYNYRDQPGSDFLKIVPTTWTDTQVIHGSVGRFITIARQSGSDWFLGSMTHSSEQTLDIPLDFLGPGTYKAIIWQDAPDAHVNPAHLQKTEQTVTAEDRLTAELAPAGGQVVHLIPLDD